jgi:hypothetical protein
VDTATATPVQIDTELARIGEAVAIQYDIINRANRAAQKWQDAQGTTGHHYDTQIAAALDRAEKAWVAWDILTAERAPYDLEFSRRDGWTRYYLVDSDTGNGHVHYDLSSSRCSRQPSTRHFWLTSESGKPAAEVIALAGERVCTICFPDAPAVGKCAYRTPSEEEKERRAAERAAAAAKRAEKAITNPDGTPLRINLNGYWDTITTVAAAWRELVDIPFGARTFGDRRTNDREVAACQLIIKALAHKLGQPEDTIKTQAEVKLIKKCRREGVTYTAN